MSDVDPSIIERSVEKTDIWLKELTEDLDGAAVGRLLRRHLADEELDVVIAVLPDSFRPLIEA